MSSPEIQSSSFRVAPIGERSAAVDPRPDGFFRDVPHALVGGLRIAALDRRQTAQLMVETAIARRGAGRPLLLSSANGEVVSRCASSPEIAALFAQQDLLSADGEPLVIASRHLCRTELPERVATTDLFHDVAPLAIARDVTHYVYGATPSENARAMQRIRTLYPELKVVGSSHGYLEGAELEARIDEINALAPDILWLALGVPREQVFALRYRSRLGNVGLIKTSGGLLNFLSGTRSRAPEWMQRAALEWLWRIKEEPTRLFMRYAVTNPHALMLLLTRSA